MRFFALKTSGKLLTGAALAIVLVGGACQQSATNTATTTNDNAANVAQSNASNTANANTTDTTTAGVSIETREPDQYSATIKMKLEMAGSQSVNLPTLTATFARSGANRRVSFKSPTGDEVIYLDRADKHYVVLPGRKQYAEIDEKSTGFDVKTMMSPAQIVSQVKNVKGCVNSGEEQFGGRTAIKYTCAGAAKTGTQAGEAKAEAVIYIDKETSLPLHSEALINSSGNVSGANSAKFVSELSDIQTTIPPNTFDEPTGMSKVDPAQVRGQLEIILKAAAIFMQNIMQNSSAPPPPPSPSSATPTK
ncbi:MAG TPA: hypothetical protein VF791_21515 [Pyrinomonadaceae bacterium]